MAPVDLAHERAQVRGRGERRRLACRGGPRLDAGAALTPVRTSPARGSGLAPARGLTRPATSTAIASTRHNMASVKRGSVPLVYVSMSRLRVAAEQSDALVAAFRDRARLVDDADGFVDLQVWRSDRDPEEVLMVSRWRDRAAFTAYMRSAEHRVSHDRIDPELKAAIKLERLEHLHTYEVVAE